MPSRRSADGQSREPKEVATVALFWPRTFVVHDRHGPGSHRRTAHLVTRAAATMQSEAMRRSGGDVSAVICEPVRTPIGRYGGMFRSLSVVDLAVAALTGLLQRTGLPRDAVDDVILGHCYPNPEAPALGAWSHSTPGCRSPSGHTGGPPLRIRPAIGDPTPVYRWPRG